MTNSVPTSKRSPVEDRMLKQGGKSLSWRLILPVPIAIIVCIAAIALIVPNIMADNAREQATRQGQQVAAGTNEVAQNITGVTQAADESLKSADQVLSASRDVASNADQLRKVVDEFLEGVAAA